MLLIISRFRYVRTNLRARIVGQWMTYASRMMSFLLRLALVCRCVECCLTERVLRLMEMASHFRFGLVIINFDIF